MISDINYIHGKVKGRVQGVGYRAWVRKIAKKYDYKDGLLIVKISQ